MRYIKNGSVNAKTYTVNPNLTRSFSETTKNGSSYLGVRVNPGGVFLDILLNK